MGARLWYCAVEGVKSSDVLLLCSTVLPFFPKAFPLHYYHYDVLGYIWKSGGVARFKNAQDFLLFKCNKQWCNGSSRYSASLRVPA